MIRNNKWTIKAVLAMPVACTVCSGCGQDASEADGQEDRKSLYYHFYEYPGEHAARRHYGVRTDRWKLIHFYGHDIDSWELYDLEKDPTEMNNLYGDRSYRRVQKKLHKELLRLQELYDDPVEQELAQGNQ